MKCRPINEPDGLFHVLNRANQGSVSARLILANLNGSANLDCEEWPVVMDDVCFPFHLITYCHLGIALGHRMKAHPWPIREKEGIALADT